MNSLSNKCILCLLPNKNLKDIDSIDHDDILIELKLKYVLPDEEITTYYNKIVSHTPISPKHVCIVCLEELNHVYKFKQKCWTNLKSLFEHLEKLGREVNLELTNNYGIENINIKIEPEDNLENTTHNNLEELHTNHLDETQTNNLEEVVVKGEPEVFHYNLDIRKDLFLPENTFNETTNNAGTDPPTSEDPYRPYKCPECHKSFKRANHLVRHKLTHSGERPFPCNTCQKSFRNKHHLITHMYTHATDLTVKCDLCDKAFKNKYYLATHRRLHTGEKPFQCDVCDKDFIYKASLVIHKRAHTGERPYECEVCDKAFVSMSHLVEHNRTHTGERPYKCDMCDKAFSHTKSLKTHKHAHTGVKPYQCGLCPYKCITSANLKSHILRRHPKENTRNADN